ncbi:LytTR family DNA-binding domain-containing protein [Staphylococcus ureilyticus]|uniref:LytTR family DNA-binding domain-containing protein n=1 Tax=Staphylococcus ureilyticus TaxID=94138 RepID=UPI0011AA6AC9|nr:LytTR family DNA-binding domain-containing protein [Staphylococcus ureilyticus]MDV3052847.1 LytTR family DNA-binding domain-containing protein [Staphylococcus ureilyticus]UXS60009.1 LytTR family transcriptional regulator DNA-binding domain-containing protein [Staphylococcus ureilyticus]
MESDVRVHLKIDEVRTITEVKINTFDRKTGESLLEHINNFTFSNLDKLGIKTSEGIFMISKSDIMFAEIFDKEITITTTEKELTTRMSLNTLQHKLAGALFIQISKSSIINVHFIKKVNPSFSGNLIATLTNGKKVSISRRYVKNLNKALGI